MARHYPGRFLITNLPNGSRSGKGVGGVSRPTEDAVVRSEEDESTPEVKLQEFQNGWHISTPEGNWARLPGVLRGASAAEAEDYVRRLLPSLGHSGRARPLPTHSMLDRLPTAYTPRSPGVAHPLTPQQQRQFYRPTPDHFDTFEDPQQSATQKRLRNLRGYGGGL